MDRLQSRQDPLLNSETYQYDKNGRVVSYVDRRGVATNYSYDSLGRRTFAGFGFNGSSYDSTINYTFDAADRLRQTVDSLTGTITRTFDGLDGLLSEVTPQGTVSYTYDADERRQTMTVAGQSEVQYSFDPDSRLTQTAQNSSTVTFGYDSDGRRTSLTLPNGVTVAYGYDQASELTTIQYQSPSATLGNLVYAYDLAGRRTGVTGSFARTNLPSPVAGAQYNVNNQLTQWGSVSPTYDNNGNLQNDGINSYSWNSRNQLASMNNATDVFTYDSFGRRITKSIAGTAKSFLYGGRNVVQELQGANPTANLLTGGIDEILQRTDSSGTWNLLADALGSTLALSDRTGAIQTQYTYEPFGNTTATGASSTNVNQYTGRELDETGLYFYRARYYKASIGRYISEDPIGFNGGVNLYEIVTDDPINNTDPTGEDCRTIGPWTFCWGQQGEYPSEIAVDDAHEASHRADGLASQLLTDFSPAACDDQESRAFAAEIPVIDARLRELANQHCPKADEERRRLMTERQLAQDIANDARQYCRDVHKYNPFYQPWLRPGEWQGGYPTAGPAVDDPRAP